MSGGDMTYQVLAGAWGDTGKTRKARKEGKCEDCRNTIPVGTKYIVGSQRDYQHGPYAYHRLCAPCGAEYGYFVDARQAPVAQSNSGEISYDLSKAAKNGMGPGFCASRHADLTDAEYKKVADALDVAPNIKVRVYRVKTPSGVIADGQWTRREDIPARIPDRFNNYFDTAEAEIIEVEN